MGNTIKKYLKIDGMHCKGCEKTIINILKNEKSIFDIEANVKKGNGYVSFDSDKITIEKISELIENAGYKIKFISDDPIEEPTEKEKRKNILQIISIVVIIIALYLIVNKTIGFNFIPTITPQMGFGIIFLVGLLTSIHCLAMCGGINISQCVGGNECKEKKFIKGESLKNSFLYNLGRVISYTLIGGLVGALGSVLSLSTHTKTIITVIAGILMIFVGLKMFGTFGFLNKLNLRLPLFLENIFSGNNKYSPFVVGLLNSLMPCGPLQAMQLYALGTGSIINGALSMFFFSLGTVPLMFGLGAITTILSNKFSLTILKVSAVMVMLLGLVMVNRGFALSGQGVVISTSTNISKNISSINGDVQEVTSRITSKGYEPIIVQNGIKVRWRINTTSQDLNGCNNPLTIPEYNITKNLSPGENIIEFTPQKTGKIIYTCWMGMVSSTITVVDDITKVNDKDIKKEETASINNSLKGGSCCSNSSINAPAVSYKAKIIDGKQDVEFVVNDLGYTPNLIVLQKGVKTKFKFSLQKLSNCNYMVNIPVFNKTLNLQKGEVEVEFIPDKSFTFSCWMGMVSVNVVVVENLNKVDINEIEKLVKEQIKNNPKKGCCG